MHRPIRRFVPLLAILVGSFAPTPAPVAGQEAWPAIVGGAGGLLAGTMVAVGVVSAEARRGQYLFALRDAFGWRSAPIALGTAAGVAIGLSGWDRLGRAGLGGLAGGAAGALAGTAYGALRWDGSEGRWAGGVIGGAAGLILGAAIGALRSPEEEQGAAAAGIPLAVRVPLP